MQPQTPGVYTIEKNAFSNSVVEVATAIPAFVGYTQQATYEGKSLTNIPTKVESFKQFQDYFGGAFLQKFDLNIQVTDKDANAAAPDTDKFAILPSPINFALSQNNYSYDLTPIGDSLQYLYSAIHLFYLNGGSTCYIVSIGDHNAVPDADDFIAGIDLLVFEQDPTMLLCPDALRLEQGQYNAVMQHMLAHCELTQSRVALLDVYRGAVTKPDTNLIDKCIGDFREGAGENSLKYGISYFPWVHTSLLATTQVSFLNLTDTALIELRKVLNPDQASDGSTDAAAAAAAATATANSKAVADASAAAKANSDDAKAAAAAVTAVPNTTPALVAAATAAATKATLAVTAAAAAAAATATPADNNLKAVAAAAAAAANNPTDVKAASDLVTQASPAPDQTIITAVSGLTGTPTVADVVEAAATAMAALTNPTTDVKAVSAAALSAKTAPTDAKAAADAVTQATPATNKIATDATAAAANAAAAVVAAAQAAANAAPPSSAAAPSITTVTAVTTATEANKDAQDLNTAKQNTQPKQADIDNARARAVTAATVATVTSAIAAQVVTKEALDAATTVVTSAQGTLATANQQISTTTQTLLGAIDALRADPSNPTLMGNLSTAQVAADTAHSTATTAASTLAWAQQQLAQATAADTAANKAITVAMAGIAAGSGLTAPATTNPKAYQVPVLASKPGGQSTTTPLVRENIFTQAIKLLQNNAMDNAWVKDKPEVPKLLQDKRDSIDNALRTIFPAYALIMTSVTRYLNTMPVAPAMAGVYTAVDNSRGVWKAPANLSLNSVVAPTVSLSDKIQENLNVDAQTGKSINAIRAFKGLGTLAWGARTLDGNSKDWRFINVRRTLIMIEQSVKLAARAYVFEPNDANTWTNVKSMINSFLFNLWKQGALAGAVPTDAYSVAVGLGSTMTADDILEGMMNVTVLVAIVRPAEFIMLTFQQQLQKS